MILRMSPRATILGIQAGGSCGTCPGADTLPWPVSVDRVHLPLPGSSGQPSSPSGVAPSRPGSRRERDPGSLSARRRGWSMPDSRQNNWFVNCRRPWSCARQRHAGRSVPRRRPTPTPTTRSGTRTMTVRPVVVVRRTDGTKTEHGFASLFQMPGSGFGVVWLDGRRPAG